MVLSCIMCGNPAGSREHIFPAAFGGRRKNKGIYCEKHNNDLGHHVTELLKALSFFNASLGVRSDHYDIPQSHLIAQPNGQRLQLLHDNIEVAPPPHLSQTPEILGKKTVLEFSSIPQRDRWMEKQRKQGFQFQEASAGDSRTEYFVSPIMQRLTFGTDEFRCAIAYLGLTLLAHYFPDLARHDSLSSIKKCVLSEEPIDDRVWWVDPSKLNMPTVVSFPAVHSAVIQISGDTGLTTGIIWLFKHICLAVNLGVVPHTQDELITTLFDPLAERPGPNKDLLEVSGGLLFAVPSVEDGRNYLGKVINQEVQNPVSKILNEHREIHLARLVRDLLPRLQTAQNQNSAERLHLVRMIVDEQGQRILNLLKQGIDMFVEETDLPPIIVEALKQAVVEDNTTKHKLSEKSMGYLVLAKAAFLAELIQLLSTGALDEEKLALIFGDGLGIGTATQPVVHAIIENISLPHNP